MIETLYDLATHRHAGSAAIGVAVAMGLWLWMPDAPGWFHLGGAFVVTTICTGGMAEVYVRFYQTIDEADEG